MTCIAENLRTVQQRIESAAKRAGRDASDIRLVVVSKNRTIETIREAMHAGATRFGENRAQEFARKQQEEPGLEWHFVGHLQTNKVGLVAGKVALIHSVDSLRLAECISVRAQEADIIQEVLVQVNVSGEESKYGLAEAEAVHACREMSEMPGIAVCGLMTMAPLTEEPEEARPVFRAARLLRDEMQRACPKAHLRWLSMGMSGDFEVAVEEGANLLRIGTAVFS